MRIKHQLGFFALTLVAILVIPVALANALQPLDSPPQIEEVVIRIDGMTCSSCANGVAASLRRVEGVIEANVTIDPPEARIKFDPSVTSAEGLVEAIQDLGYEAEVVGA